MYNLLQFFISQSYLFIAFEFILLLSTFSGFLKILNNYFFRWLAYKSLLSRFSVLISYTMWYFNLFSAFNCFQRFSWSRFFRVQFFLGPGFSESRSMVWVQVLERAVKSNKRRLNDVEIIFKIKLCNCLNKAKNC